MSERWQHFIGNKAKGWISKRVLQENRIRQITPRLPGMHFIPPEMYKYVWVSGGKQCLFFGKFNVLYFLVTSVFLLQTTYALKDNILHRIALDETTNRCRKWWFLNCFFSSGLNLDRWLCKAFFQKMKTANPIKPHVKVPVQQRPFLV